MILDYIYYPTTIYLYLFIIKFMMLDKKDIEDVLIKDNKVASLTFRYYGDEYKALVTPEEIKLSERKKIIAEYDRKKDKIEWHLPTTDHYCGLQGFGQSVLDRCYGCDANDFSKILKKGIPEYCSDLEKKMK